MDNDQSPLLAPDDYNEDDDVAVSSVDPTALPDDQWDDMVTCCNPNNSIVAPDGYTWFGKFALFALDQQERRCTLLRHLSLVER